MSDTGSSALRRMIGASRRLPGHGSVHAEDALALALSRAGQETARTALSADSVRRATAPLGGLATVLPAGGLWVLLQGPQRLRGILGLDASLLTGLVQSLTTGQVRAGDGGTRAATQTDALLLRRFFAALLETLAHRLDGQPEADWAAGYQPRDRVADAARLPHLLPDMPYLVVSCDVDMADGVRRGTCVLALPQASPTAQADDPRAAERAAFTAALGRVVADAPAELEAVLCRMSLSLDRVAGLAPDSLLPVPRHAVSEIVLQGCDGRQIATARLGQSRGVRAVKVLTTAAGAARPAADDATPTAPPDPPGAAAGVPAVVSDGDEG